MIESRLFIAKRDATEEYSYGKCMWFALALHDLTQWPIQAILDNDGYIGHSWVVMPTGECLDVSGLNGAQDFIQFNPEGIKNFSRQEFTQLISQENHYELLKAKILILNIYDIELSSVIIPHKKNKIK